MERSETTVAWEFEHSVECGAPRGFCWEYWTDVAKWDDPPARFRVDGPFADGARITTELPGQTLVSVIQDVEEGRAATIELGLPNAVFRFHWRFDDLDGSEGKRTRISQRLELSGEDAGLFVEQAKVMGETAPDGVRKLVGAMERAWDELTAGKLAK
jgi:hypothetical protein